MPFGKMYRKAVKRAGVRKIGRKVYKATGLSNPVKRGKISSSRLINDVQRIKSMLNSEKKELKFLPTTATIGQVQGAGFGHYIQDITPVMSQGITGQTRNGISIRVNSFVLKGQLIQQSAAVQSQKIRVEIFLNKSTPLSTVGLISSIYDVNPLNNLYDINAPRAIDTYKNWVKVASRRFNIGQDNQSGVTGFRDMVLPLKFKSYRVKYDSDNTNTVTNGQLIMVITADSGNTSNATASTLTTIPVTAVNTGSTLNYYMQYWFYDN